MIIASVNYFALLPCLAVLCTLFIAGIAVMSVLIAKAHKINKNMMQKDVYSRNNETLNCDCDKTVDNNASEEEKNTKSETVEISSDISEDEVQE